MVPSPGDVPSADHALGSLLRPRGLGVPEGSRAGGGVYGPTRRARQAPFRLLGDFFQRSCSTEQSSARFSSRICSADQVEVPDPQGFPDEVELVAIVEAHPIPHLARAKSRFLIPAQYGQLLPATLQ